MGHLSSPWLDNTSSSSVRVQIFQARSISSSDFHFPIVVDDRYNRDRKCSARSKRLPVLFSSVWKVSPTPIQDRMWPLGCCSVQTTKKLTFGLDSLLNRFSGRPNWLSAVAAGAVERSRRLSRKALTHQRNCNFKSLWPAAPHNKVCLTLSPSLTLSLLPPSLSHSKRSLATGGAPSHQPTT